MDTFAVTVKYQLNQTGNPADSTMGTIIIRRKAKDAGTAISIVTALMNSLSNVVFESGISNITVLKAYVADV